MLSTLAENERFVVERSVGSGGMGAVYRAIDRVSGAPVALKVALDDSLDYRSRALSEAGALAALDHPAIVRLVASGLGTDGRPFLAMEWLDGEDLAKRLARGPLSLVETVRMGIQLSAGLVAAHTIGIIHRDLKPSNIFLPGRSIDHAKLVDFGLARSTERRVTATGAILGTPGYMAPEQAMGRNDIGFPVDIFALGAVLYECIWGEAPFSGAHALAILAKVLFEEVIPLHSRHIAIPAKLSELITRMLSKTADERPTAIEVTKVLSDILSQLVKDADLPSTELVPARGYGRVSTEFELLLSGEQQLVCVLVARFPNMTPSELDDTLRIAALTSESSIRRRDENEPVERLRLVVAPLGGRAEQLLDGTLIASWRGLGTPRDLAARAARAALLAHERLPGCTLALGSGLVSAEEHQTFGAVLDRAVASIENFSTSGICIDDITAGLLDARFIVEVSSGMHLLVGRRAFDSGASRRLAGKTIPCIGRERELRMLGELLEDCIEASRATAAMVTAPAGIGKSRLCRELLRLTRLRDDVEVWTAEADELGIGSPFALIGAFVQSAIGVKPSDTLDERREKLLARVQRHVAQKERSRVAAMLGEIASIPFAESMDHVLAAARHDPSVMAEQLRRAFVDWLDAETQHHPVLVVFEDMHWADAPSVKMVTTVLTTLRSRPLMLLGFARPEVEQRFPTLFAFRELQEIRLAGLTKRSAAKLVQHVLPEASADLVQRLVERADGNTLYLEELVRAAANGRDDNLPETVTAMVQARILELAPEERRVVRAASVFGGAFWFGAVATILGGKANATTGVKISVFDSLVEQEILERRQESLFKGDQEFVFRHALLREGAYALLSETDRAACHLRAAEWFENQAYETDPERIGYHFELGGARDRASEWYAHAASNALRAGDPAGAVIAAERGLALLSTLAPSVELDLHISRFQGLMSTRGYTVPEVETSLHRAEELCPRGAPARYTVTHGLWIRHLAGGDVWTSRAFAAEMLASAECEAKPSAKVVAHLALGMTCVFLGEHDAARENLEAALHMFNRENHPEASLMMGADIEVFTSCYLAMTYWALGKLDQGEQLIHRALDVAEKLAHPFTRTVAASFASIHYQARRQRLPTLDYAKRTHELALEHGFSHYIIQSQIVRGWALLEKSNALTIIQAMTLAVDSRRSQGGLIAVPHLLTMVIQAKLVAGDVDGALHELDKAFAIMNKTGERVFAPELHRLLGEAFMTRGHRGDIDRAEDALLCACEVAHYQNSRTQELRATLSLARLWKTVGNGGEGKQRLQRLLARFAEGISSPDVQEAQDFLTEENGL